MQTTQKLAYDALALHNKQPYAFGPLFIALRALMQARMESDAIRYAHKFANRYGVEASAGDALLKLVSTLPIKHFAPGEVIVKEGEASDELFVIHFGQVRVERDGEGLLATLGIGQSFGEIAMLTGARRTASVIADDAVSLFQITRREMDRISHDMPALDEVLWQVCRSRLINQLLPESSCLGQLPLAQRQELLTLFMTRTVPANTALLIQGQKETAFSVILSGKALVWRINDKGSHEKLAELGPGDFFGEMQLLLDTPVSANVESLTPMTYFSLRKPVFDQVMESYPEERDRLVAIAQQRREANVMQPHTILPQPKPVTEAPEPEDPPNICPFCNYDQVTGSNCPNCGINIEEERNRIKSQMKTAPWDRFHFH